MRILGIETSCDETAVAILEGDFDVRKAKTGDFDSGGNFARDLKLLANVVVSQIDIFKEYGGVIPEVAARSHLEAMMPVVHRAFREAGFVVKADSDGVDGGDLKDDWSKIDAIAVTHTPGLLGSLLVGTLTARTLAILHEKPLYAVHHLKSHIYANWLPGEGTLSGAETGKGEVKAALEMLNFVPGFPLLALVISGGHTQIIYMREHNHFEIVGTTHDDAVGECFDKVAKILGLPYPGGPAISRAAKGDLAGWSGGAQSDNPDDARAGMLDGAKVGVLGGAKVGDRFRYRFPHPQGGGELDFSFSGLKTAVLRTVQKVCGVPISYPSTELKKLLTTEEVCDLAASFEETAVEILLEKMERALEIYPDVKNVVFAGGVSANGLLREEAEKRSGKALSGFLRGEVKNGTAKGRLGSEILKEKFGDVKVFFPEVKFSGDNGAMVAAAGYYEILSGVEPTDPYALNIMPRSEIR